MIGDTNNRSKLSNSAEADYLGFDGHARLHESLCLGNLQKYRARSQLPSQTAELEHAHVPHAEHPLVLKAFMSLTYVDRFLRPSLHPFACNAEGLFRPFPTCFCGTG